jgi:hypothetical protein
MQDKLNITKIGAPVKSDKSGYFEGQPGKLSRQSSVAAASTATKAEFTSRLDKNLNESKPSNASKSQDSTLHARDNESAAVANEPANAKQLQGHANTKQETKPGANHQASPSTQGQSIEDQVTDAYEKIANESTTLEDILNGFASLFQAMESFLQQNPDMAQTENLDFNGMLDVQNIMESFQQTLGKILENWKGLFTQDGQQSMQFSAQLSMSAQSGPNGNSLQLMGQLTATMENLVQADLYSFEGLKEYVTQMQGTLASLLESGIGEFFSKEDHNAFIALEQSVQKFSELLVGKQPGVEHAESVVAVAALSEPATKVADVMPSDGRAQGDVAMSVNQNVLTDDVHSKAGSGDNGGLPGEQNQDQSKQKNSGDSEFSNTPFAKNIAGNETEKLAQSPVNAPSEKELALLKEGASKESSPLSNAGNAGNAGASGSVSEALQDTLKPEGVAISAQSSESKPSANGLVTVKSETTFLRPHTLEAHVLQQVGDKIKVMNKEGKQIMTIQLDPKELGKIELRVEMEDKQLRVHMTVENDKVKSLMEARVPQLRELLESNQVNMERMEVTVNKEKPAPDRQQEKGRKKHMLRHGEGMQVKVAPDTEDTGRRLGYNTMELVA